MMWLLIFLLLDLYTTVFGLRIGFQELNPVLSSMLRLPGISGLVLSRILAVVMASYFLYSGRLLLLRRATVVMALVVGWNLFWLFRS